MPRSLTLSFELLETFVALIRHDGEAAAVMRELELNQPTLSKRLRHLQHKGALLDRPWLVREGKTWKLTTEGHKVWPAVEDLVDRHRNLERYVDLGGRTSGNDSVHFACGQEMAAGLVRAAPPRVPPEAPRRAVAHLDPAWARTHRRGVQRLDRSGRRLA